MQRHGGRRRRCASCYKTWVVRPARRGPKPRRVDRPLLVNMLVKHTPTSVLARLCRTSAAAIRRRCRRACDGVTARSTPTVPADAAQILLVDGLWFAFHGRQQVLYNMAVKPVTGTTALLLTPILVEGVELGGKWSAVIDRLPTSLLAQVKAMVSDGFRGAKRIAAKHGWIHQRCHFHLLATLRSGLTGRKRVVDGWLVRAWLYRCTDAALKALDRNDLTEFCLMIRYWSEQPECPRRMRLAAHDFMRQLASFRAYIDHPELHLPRTVGALDSYHRVLRRVVFGVNNPDAMLRRVKAFIQLHPTITCNGSNFPPK